MQVRHSFPAHAATGACFITRKHQPPPEGIIDLDVDLDDLPAFGSLCVHPVAVEAMAGALGWKVMKSGAQENNRKLKAANDQLRAELAELRSALRSVLEAGALVGVEVEVDPELVGADS
jgi:hypothetical protein